MQNTLFITGTDTDAGKTVVTCAFAAYWQIYRPDTRLAIMKPLQSGTGDREIYQSLFSLDLSAQQITPQSFTAPLAPPIAAALENRQIDLGVVWKELRNLQATRDFVLVEALGGLGSPVTDELTVADIAGEWRLPTILVVPVRLGAISQAVANVALARQTKVNLLGIILNCTQPWTEEEIHNLTPVGMIQRLTNVPVYGVFPYLENTQDLSQLALATSELELERIFPSLKIPGKAGN